MKKVLSLACVAGTLALHAQQCQWAHTSGGMTGDACLSVTADAAGNSYTAGFFTGTADFGFGQVVSVGTKDAFVLKRNPSGTPVWLRVFGGSGEEEIRDVAMAPDGSLYATGWFDSPLLVLGNMATLVNPDTMTQKAMLFRLDSAGTTLWALQSSGTGSGQSFSVACDRAGNAYIAGAYIDTILWNSMMLLSSGSRDVFVVGYDSSGAILFASSAGSAHDDAAYGIACDPHGCFIVIAGYFNFGAMQTDSACFGSQTVQSIGYTDAFVARYDLGGNCAWVRAAGGSNFGDEARGVAVSDSGTVFVTGHFSGNALFGANLLSTLSSSDAFIAAYDSIGNCAWATSLGSMPQGNATAYDVALDGMGNPAVVGGFEGQFLFGQKMYVSTGWYDGFAACFGRTSGVPFWAASTGGLDEDWLCAVTADFSGAWHMAGVCSSSPAYFGSCTASTSGQADGYEAKCAVPASGLASSVEHPYVLAYPNPFYDQCQILLPACGVFELSLIDMYGREVRHSVAPLGGIVAFDRGSLPSGAYCLIVRSADNTTSVIRLSIQ